MTVMSCEFESHSLHIQNQTPLTRINTMRQFLCKPNAEASSLDYAEAQPKIAKQKTMRQFLCKLSAEEVYLLCRNAAKNRAKFEKFCGNSSVGRA